MTQRDRLHSIDTFRKSSHKILIATDVAGRGIHVDDITHVFNYEIPHSLDGYTHRIGRTGRMGNKGIAITLVTPKENSSFKRLLNLKNQEVRFSPLPSHEEVKLHRKETFIETIRKEDNHEDAEQILSLLLEKSSHKEIVLKLISKLWSKEADLSSERLQTPQLEIKDRSGRKKRQKDFEHNKSRSRHFHKRSYRKSKIR